MLKILCSFWKRPWKYVLWNFVSFSLTYLYISINTKMQISIIIHWHLNKPKFKLVNRNISHFILRLPPKKIWECGALNTGRHRQTNKGLFWDVQVTSSSSSCFFFSVANRFLLCHFCHRRIYIAFNYYHLTTSIYMMLC